MIGTAMITNLAVFEGGERAIHELSALYPDYKAAETQEKIQHFLQSGTKPITCKAIAEKGLFLPKHGGWLLLLQSPGSPLLSAAVLGGVAGTSRRCGGV